MVVAGERHGQKLSHRELDVQMVAGSTWRSIPKPMLQKYSCMTPILHQAATCRAEVAAMLT